VEPGTVVRSPHQPWFVERRLGGTNGLTPAQIYSHFPVQGRLRRTSWRLILPKIYGFLIDNLWATQPVLELLQAIYSIFLLHGQEGVTPRTQRSGPPRASYFHLRLASSDLRKPACPHRSQSAAESWYSAGALFGEETCNLHASWPGFSTPQDGGLESAFHLS
jgi:hypothetical protein